MTEAGPVLEPIFGAAGAVDITPGRPALLAGYENRSILARRVGHRLQASALVLADGQGRQQALVSLDLLFAGPELTERLRLFAQRELGIDRRNLLLAASHTHFAPPVDATKPALGAVDRAYLDWLCDRCCTLLGAVARQEKRPMRFRAIKVPWDGAVYRRRLWWLPHVKRRRLALGGVVMAPARSRAAGHELRLVELLDPCGSPVALLWSASCHPTGSPDIAAASSDYIGAVRERLGAEVPMLFLQGFAGDLRPDVPDRRTREHRIRRALVYGPSFDSFDLPRWEAWIDRLAGAVAAGLDELRRRSPAPLTGPLAGALVEVPLREITAGYDGPPRPVGFQRLRAGAMYDILAVSAEPCSMLRFLLDDAAVWPVGYVGDVFGYWPTERQRLEGGYEVDGFLAPFNLSGRLRPGLDCIFLNATEAVAAELACDIAALPAGTGAVDAAGHPALCDLPRRVGDEHEAAAPVSGDTALAHGVAAPAP